RPHGRTGRPGTRIVRAQGPALGQAARRAYRGTQPAPLVRPAARTRRRKPPPGRSSTQPGTIAGHGLGPYPQSRHAPAPTGGPETRTSYATAMVSGGVPFSQAFQRRRIAGGRAGAFGDMPSEFRIASRGR